MSGVNKVILVGRLGADPEVKDLGEGNFVANFSMATSEKYKDKSGEMQEKTEWHRIVVWGKLAEICGKYLKKGREAYVDGKLQTRSWEDKEGVTKYTTEVVAKEVQFLGSSADAGASQRPSTESNAGVPNFAPGKSHGPSLEDSTPF